MEYTYIFQIISSNLVAFFFKNDFNYRFESMIEQIIHESPTFQLFMNGNKDSDRFQKEILSSSLRSCFTQHAHKKLFANFIKSATVNQTACQSFSLKQVWFRDAHLFFFYSTFWQPQLTLTFKKGNCTAFSPISYAWSALDDHVYLRKMLNFNSSFKDIFVLHEIKFLYRFC